MKTLRNLTNLILALVWTAAAIAILPLSVIGAFQFSGRLFLSAWICAILLIGIPMLSYLLKKHLS